MLFVSGWSTPSWLSTVFVISLQMPSVIYLSALWTKFALDLQLQLSSSFVPCAYAFSYIHVYCVEGVFVCLFVCFIFISVYLDLTSGE